MDHPCAHVINPVTNHQIKKKLTVMVILYIYETIMQGDFFSDPESASINEIGETSGEI